MNRYVEQTYSHLDLHTERFGHDFKTGGYYAYLCSESSGDTAFYVRTDMLGRIRQDSFDIWVAHKYNTELRIREEYRLLADAVFQSGTIPYAMDIGYGDITFAGDEQWGEAEYAFALSRDILVLDKVYDVRELARNAGVLTVYAMDETVTVQKAAEIMLCIRSAFEEADHALHPLSLRGSAGAFPPAGLCAAYPDARRRKPLARYSGLCPDPV